MLLQPLVELGGMRILANYGDGRMIRKTFLLGLLAVGLACQHVVQASAQSTYDWTGFYAGFGAGYGFFDAKDKSWGGGNPDPDGFLATAFAGANYQIGQMVLGVEADISGGDVTGSNLGSGGYLVPLEVHYIGTVRGRIGYAMGDLVVYATGGMAYARFFAEHDQPPAGAATREFELGWTVGGGIDWHVANNWFMRAEYLYTDFGTNTFGFSGGGDPHRVSIDGNMVRLSVGFNF